ncbi:60S acidic ribosomal protein [Lachnellula occidentalis]|uniref:Large ribosomal subunit protein P1 n=1 Tax=Lachnellula occidentalis TaxID=215460 RepID=A0A8H8S217_9HELO|nr:60S acidic ribosomal protein [Lachnellula occidentalis]
MSHAELAVSYAALILADDGVDVTADKLQTLIKAAGVEEVEPIWTSLFAKALEGKDVKELLLNVGSGGGAAAAPAAGGASGGEAAAEEAKPEEKEEGKNDPATLLVYTAQYTNTDNSQRGVRRGYGFRSFRLSALQHFLSELTNAWHGSLRCGIWLVE